MRIKSRRAFARFVLLFVVPVTALLAGGHYWVKNTRYGTVIGEAEGAADSVEALRKWLSETGSPKSRIDRAEFKELHGHVKYGRDGFVRRKT